MQSEEQQKSEGEIQRTNLAARLLDIFRRLDAMPTGKTLTVAMAEAFPANGRNVEPHILACERIGLLIKDLELLAVLLARTQVGPEVWREGIYRLRAEVSNFVFVLNSNWHDIRQRILREDIKTLHWGAAMLPKDEIVIKREDLVPLVDALHALRRLVAEGNLPASLHSNLLRCLEVMDRAISEFAFRGGAALSDVMMEFSRYLYERRDDIKEHASEETMSVLERFWDKCCAATRPLMQSESLITFLGIAYKQANEVFALTKQ